MRVLDLRGEDGEKISFIVREYERINQDFMPRILLEKAKEYYAEGLSAEVIVKAIEISAIRGAKWEYTEGILKRLLEEEITTLYLWEKKKLFKKSKAEIRKRFRITDEKELNRLALFEAFKDEIKREQDKLEEFIKTPHPEIEIPRLTEEQREEFRKRREEITKELKEKRERGEMTFPPFW